MLRMYRYNRILIFMVIAFVLTSLFALTASAEGVTGDLGDNSIVIEETTDNGVTEAPVQSDEVITSTADLEETNLYLRYITGILVFFLVVLLFYWCYKFFSMFF